MVGFESVKKWRKMFFVLSRALEEQKIVWVPMRNRTSDLWIPRSDAYKYDLTSLVKNRWGEEEVVKFSGEKQFKYLNTWIFAAYSRKRTNKICLVWISLPSRCGFLFIFLILWLFKYFPAWTSWCCGQKRVSGNSGTHLVGKDFCLILLHGESADSRQWWCGGLCFPNEGEVTSYDHLVYEVLLKWSLIAERPRLVKYSRLKALGLDVNGCLVQLPFT